MDNHNPVFEALAKPQFETIKVGTVFYRAIRVPQWIRAYTDTPKWDQKKATAAKREDAMGEFWDREESELSASAFTDPNMSSEDKSGNEDDEKRRTYRVEEEQNSAVSCDADENEQEDGFSNHTNAGKGDKPQPLETISASFWTVDGPSLHEPTNNWVLKLQMWWPLRTLFVKGRGALMTKVSKQYGVEMDLRSYRPRFVARLQARESSSLLRAGEFLKSFIEKSVESLPYTHFISLPLTDPRFQDRYNIFKTQVLAAYPGFDEALFAKPEGLHITVLLLRVITEEQDTRCREVLDNLSREVYDAVDTRSLVLHLKGLDLMNDDSSAATVIFTTQYTGNEKDRETDHRLRRLRLVITEAFRAAGLISEKEILRQQVNEFNNDVEAKLHATLLNAKFRRNALGGRQPTVNQKPQTAGHAKSVQTSGRTYDATQLLSEFKLFDFFESRVPCVELVARAFYYPVNKHVVETSVLLP